MAYYIVAVVPDGAPVVSVDRGGLERGGPLLADCTAPPASPAPNLTWYVNDQRVSVSIPFKCLLKYVKRKPETDQIQHSVIKFINCRGFRPVCIL